MTNEPNKRPAGDPARTPIPVEELRFCRPNGLEVPIPSTHGGRLSQVNSITAGKQPERDAVVAIAFLPWMRRYRVVFYPSPKEAPIVFSLPESWCLAIEVE